MMFRHGTIAFTLAALTCSNFSALAQSSQLLPTRPIRVLVTYAPGASTDINARAMAAKMGENMKQQFIVDNRPGASGMLATALLAKSAPDGHTLMVVDSAHGANPAIYDNMPYDTLKDIDSIGMIARLPMVLLVTPSLPVKSVKELVALAKAKPGALNYGSVGAGTAAHLSAEIFKRAGGIDIVHVPFKAVADMYTETASGRVHLLVFVVTGSLGFLKDGKVRGLAVTSHTRSFNLPDLPTVAEAGLPGAESAIHSP